MKKQKCRYGLIFDMDNTLLQSNIDFAGMKRAVFELLTESELCKPDLDWRSYTASQLIEMARQSGRLRKETEVRIWDTVAEFEKEGMHGAKLEPYVTEVLDQICGDCHLVVLTNNACVAAQEALKETGIGHYFDYIVGREQMTALKPSPSGVHYILRHYPDVPAERWMLVGDSWIDGKAAQDGGIKFAAYKGSGEDMKKKGVYPVARFTDMRELVNLLL
ncbi:HAD family hydrolase [Aneurinibacillus danicus]|uniref:Haloacid dehalogenase n=1 Tax=Aneurinibacillus danicus TaxID=267746 RepID=A0A511VGJ0_9BACL|nr:HAD-IA family hydrolase [Aneurinibacillus danicus]GEN36663.1 hypothetical protein ADA01nite_41230 [Aneurinibacillus danicus]